MSFAHKLKTYRDDAYKNVAFCSICGQDMDLAGKCPGEPVSIQKQFDTIFPKTIKISNELKKVVDRVTKNY